ncbi:MAG: hypothetical protein KAW12_07205 [Candidatus Aminicenantes bacterium]|nr:hypothetical protein [Candidatus Aminicenantes bacterium]
MKVWKRDGVFHRFQRAFSAFRFFQPPDDEDGGSNDNVGISAYKNYAEAVQKISAMRAGGFGKSVFNTVVRLRSAFTLGVGVEIQGVESDRNKDSREWVDEFLHANSLDSKGTEILKWIKEFEYEGKMLVKLFFDKNYVWRDDKKKGMVMAKFMTWGSYQYEVFADLNNYSKYKKVKWDKKTKNLPESQFVYRKNGGRIDDVNASDMVAWDIAPFCEALEKAQSDLRKNNAYYGKPIPDLKVDTIHDVEGMQEALDKGGAKDFKKRKFFVHIGTFDLKGPPLDAAESLLKETKELKQLITGFSGVPAHFIGMPELIKNRSVSDESSYDTIAALTSDGKHEVESGINETLFKAAALYALKTKIVIDIDWIWLAFTPMNSNQWKEIGSLITMRENGDISRQTLLERTPGIDPDEEIKRLKEEAETKEKGDYERSNKRAEEIEEKKQGDHYG